MGPRPIRVLLIEDNPEDTRLIRGMLTEATGGPFVVTHADRLSAGLEHLVKRDIDLVLLDLSLPDGYGLDSFAKMHTEAPTVPFVLLIDPEDEALALKAVQVGAQDYLVKASVDGRSLARAIRYGIERQQAKEEIRRRNQELTLLKRIIAVSATSPRLELDSILESACRELALAFGIPRTAAALLNESKTTAGVVAEFLAEGQPPAPRKPGPIRDNPLFQHLLRYKAPLVVDHTQSNPRPVSIHEAIREHSPASLLLLPLIVEGEVIGSLSLDALEPRQFSTEEVSLACSVADQLTGVLARFRLDQERRLLRTAIEQAAEGVIITDPEGVILYVNPAFEQITGYNPAETIGQGPRMLKRNKHDAAFFEELWDTISAGQMWRERFINRKKDGGLYTTETSSSPVLDKHGTVINYVNVQRDLTREIELERQYYQAQKMEAIGHLAGGVAHDLNNLIMVITGYSDQLLTKFTDENDPIHESLAQIKKIAGRASSLTRQLLTAGRKQLARPVVLNLNDIVAEIDTMLRRLIGEDIRLVTLPDQNLGLIKADPGQIEQIIINLVVNARDAMPQGGKLTITTANIYLDKEDTGRLAGVEPGPYIKLSLRDTGLGMNVETQTRIFEPFFTTKDGQKGTGLGLALVYGIVKQTGGHIWLDSEPGQGTTFELFFPQVQQVAEPVINRRSGSETILLVEDEELVRELTGQVLAQRGYTILTAGSGPEALRVSKAYQDSIHLVLTDIIIPGGINGLQLADHLASLHPKLKALYMSGYPENAMIRHRIGHEDIAFLQKPFSLNDLANKVREILDT